MHQRAGQLAMGITVLEDIVAVVGRKGSADAR
jgi:hypothetical protein